MRIATMVRGYIPAPRPKDIVYAPIDLAESISEILTRKGHSVDYFGPLGSTINNRVKLRTKNLRPLVENHEDFQRLLSEGGKLAHYYPGMWDFYLAKDMFIRARKGEYDILHFHHPELALPFVSIYPDVPVIFTLHDPIYDWKKEVFELYLSKNQYFVSISNNQRLPAPDLPYVDTVYNGIDLDLFSFGQEEHDDYLLYTGRITPEKGVKEAIQVAKETNLRLIMIGPVADEAQGYYEQYIKPELNEKILHLGYIARDELPRYYQKAKAVLLPIQWEEPFGLTTVEAMACGTPVVAMRRGAMEEVIEDGVSGYIVDSIAEMVEAVKKVHLLHPKEIREHVVDNFSVEQMADNYEIAYKKAIDHFSKKNPNPLKSLRKFSHKAKKKVKQTAKPLYTTNYPKK